jgi:hypothetical protein
MARPRKLGTTEMLRIVDSYYETHGNGNLLKYSLFEDYAGSLGLAVKAYDFRRNDAVRKRVEELRGMDKVSGIQSIAYKGIDVDAFFSRNRTREALRNALLELDETWHRIYDRASELSQHNAELLKEALSGKRENGALVLQISKMEADYKEAQRLSNAFMLENRYLKRMLKQYLYPAIANEILVRENVLEQADTEATPAVMGEMVDSSVPSPFSQSVSADVVTLSREESLLRRMKNHSQGGGVDA